MKWKAGLFVLVLLLLVTLTACGGEDAAGDEGPPQSEANGSSESTSSVVGESSAVSPPEGNEAIRPGDAVMAGLGISCRLYVPNEALDGYKVWGLGWPMQPEGLYEFWRDYAGLPDTVKLLDHSTEYTDGYAVHHMDFSVELLEHLTAENESLLMYSLLDTLVSYYDGGGDYSGRELPYIYEIENEWPTAIEVTPGILEQIPGSVPEFFIEGPIEIVPIPPDELDGAASEAMAQNAPILRKTLSKAIYKHSFYLTVEGEPLITATSDLSGPLEPTDVHIQPDFIVGPIEIGEPVEIDPPMETGPGNPQQDT